MISLQQNLQIVQERADVMVVTNLNRLGEALLINPPLNAGNFKCICISTRVGPQVEKSSNLHITADSTGSIHKNARGKKFDPKKVRLGWGDLI